MKTLRQKLKNTKGVTLVELIVSVALLSIFCLCCAVLIRPCAAAFDRMQKTSRAQMIGDTIVEGLRAELMNARGTIRFAPAATDVSAAQAVAPFAEPGDFNQSSGTALEFRTTGNYYELIDAGCVPETKDKDGNLLPGTDAGKDTAGQLHMRYFANDGGNKYTYKKGNDFVGYGYSTAYTDKFYMGNTVTLKFTVQSYSRENIAGTLSTRVNSVRVDLVVIGSDNNTAHSQSAILELPNAPVLVQTKGQFSPQKK